MLFLEEAQEGGYSVDRYLVWANRNNGPEKLCRRHQSPLYPLSLFLLKTERYICAKKVTDLHTDKANPDTENIRGLNLAAVKHTTVQVTRLPL
jgi:hypothetical protein